MKNSTWRAIAEGPFWTHATSSTISVGYYQHIMREVFHYIQHTPKSQAIAGVLLPSEDHELARFAFRHSRDEVGHEHMIIQDLMSLRGGITLDLTAPPLPDTAAFIGYVYYVSVFVGARARLGLSYWIEGSYENLTPVIENLARRLELAPEQLTFFVEHQSIDKVHFERVTDAITTHCLTQADRKVLEATLETSLRMFGRMLDSATLDWLADNGAGPS